jgi:hypothetical protein
MNKPLEKLGKLSLAILENFVENKLGKKFIDELRSPTERSLAVATALERTQDRFLKEFEDKIFAENVLSKVSEISLSMLAEAVGKFYDHPTDTNFPRALQSLVSANFPYFPADRVERGIAEYIALLTEELVQVDETFLQNASAIAVVRTERWQKQILQALREKQEVNNYRGDLWIHLPTGTETTIEKIRENSRVFQTNHISEHCLDYFQHSLDHADRAIDILNNWLLDDEQKQYLINNNWTLFFLYASIYLYNIGLTSPPVLETSNLRAKSRKELLELRSQRGKLVLENFWRELGIEDASQASIIAILCLAQQDISIEDTRIKRRIPYRQTGQNINLQFIIGCLKLLYELDLNQVRIPFLLERFLRDEQETLNVFDFGGIGPHDTYLDTVHAFIRCHSMNFHRAFKSLEGHTQALLNEINRNMSPRFRYTQITYDIENIGYDPIDYRFKVEASAALEVFMGTPIYTQKATFLRELIQNSLDACNVRRIYFPSYIPKISVERKKDFKTVIVRDNGIGMDKTWVEKYFLAVGISFYRSEEFENIKGLDMGFSPISRFGIGILSCFMVADKVVIRTKKLDAVGLEITISDFRNYFEVRKDASLEQGTEIILTLKPEYADLDCLGYLLENIKFTQEPIEYIYFDGETRTIGQEPVSLVDKLKINFWKKLWENFVEEKIPLSSSNSEGYLAFSKNNSRDKDIISGDMSVCEVNIFQDGIYICNEPNLLPRWMIKNIIGRINLRDEDRVDISISRIGLLQNSKYEGLKSKINHGLALLLGNIFKMSSKNSRNRKEYYHFVKEFIKNNINLDAIDNSLAETLRKYYCFAVHKKSNEIDGYFLYEEIPNKEDIFFRQAKKSLRRQKIQLSVKGDFILGEDARILLLLNPDKSYRDGLLLRHDEKTSIKEFISQDVFILGEDDFSTDQNKDTY